MTLKTQKIALINCLLNLYGATNNETVNKFYNDSIHFCIGLTSEEATSCHEIAERLYMRGKKAMNKLTNKEAYEIIRDNTNWAWVLPQDVKFKYGWIFHRTRDCLDGEYHKCKDAIDCYATDSLYSYEHTGCQLENFECCNFDESPFKAKNEETVIKTINNLNRSYYRYKTDRFIEEIYGLVYGGLGSDAVKKYSRKDLLYKLEDWSYKIYKLGEEKKLMEDNQ